MLFSLIIVISPLPTIMRKLSFNVFKRFGRSNTQTKLEETPQSDLSRSTPNLLGSITSSRKVARRRLHKRLSGATGTEDDFSYTAVSPLRHLDNASSVGSDFIGMHPSRSTPMITEMRRDPSGPVIEEFSQYEPENQDTTYEFIERPSPFSRPPAFQHDDYARDQSSFTGSSGSIRSTPNYSSSISPTPIERRRSSRSSGQSSNGHVGVSYTPTPIPPASLNDRHTLPRSSRRNSSRPRSSRSSNDAQSVAIPTHGQQSEGQAVGPSTYYIVPGGLRAIFTDHNGNEITRVGDFTSNGHSRRISPVVVQDESGKVLYRLPEGGLAPFPSAFEGENSDSECPHCHHKKRSRHARSDARRHGSSASESDRSNSNPKHSRIVYPPYESPNIILIDGNGRQIPIRNSSDNAMPSQTS